MQCFLLHSLEHHATTNSFVFDELRVKSQQHAGRYIVWVERHRVVEVLRGGRVALRYGGSGVQDLAADRKLDFLGVPLTWLLNFHTVQSIVDFFKR